MTQRHHLKDRVRARMARTGESYSTARAQLARRARTKVRGTPKVIVPVTDIDRSRLFYANAFGFQVRAAASTWTVLGDDDDLLALEPAGSAGVDLGVGIRVADLSATLAAVVAAGGRIDSHSGAVARVADPDGNVMRLMAVGDTSHRP